MHRAWVSPCPWAFKITNNVFLQLKLSPLSRCRFRSLKIAWIRCCVTKSRSLLTTSTFSIAHAVRSFNWLWRSVGGGSADSIKTWRWRSSNDVGPMSALFLLVTQVDPVDSIKPGARMVQLPSIYHFCLQHLACPHTVFLHLHPHFQYYNFALLFFEDFVWAVQLSGLPHLPRVSVRLGSNRHLQLVPVWWLWSVLCRVEGKACFEACKWLYGWGICQLGSNFHWQQGCVWLSSDSHSQVQVPPFLSPWR